MTEQDKNNLKPEDYKEISRMVESGEIFNDAREWYLRTYLLNTVERSWLIVITFGLIFLIFTAYDYKASLMPIVTSYPVMVTIEDASEQVSRLVKLGDRDLDFNVDDIYLKLLSTEFVKAFETYDWTDDFQKLKNNGKIVSTLAYENIADDYNDRIDMRKITSFTLKYRKNTIRTVEVDKNSLKIEATNEEKGENKKFIVTGSFKASEKSLAGVAVSNWNFKIILYFKEIKYNYEKKQFEDLFFKVVNYEATKVE
jgi:type IV secretory pathway component VirB8